MHRDQFPSVVNPNEGSRAVDLVVLSRSGLRADGPVPLSINKSGCRDCLTRGSWNLLKLHWSHLRGSDCWQLCFLLSFVWLYQDWKPSGWISSSTFRECHAASPCGVYVLSALSHTLAWPGFWGTRAVQSQNINTSIRPRSPLLATQYDSSRSNPVDSQRRCDAD
jgi:hypothetical protein